MKIVNRKAAIFAAAFSIFTMAACEENEKSNRKDSAASEEKEDQKNTEKTKGITQKQYEKVKGGMAYKDVVDLFGSKGEKIGEDKEDGFATYKWKAADGKSGSAVINFENKKLVSKLAHNIRPESSVKGTKAQFDQVKEGMSLAEIEKIMGGKGNILTESDAVKGEFRSIQYMYKGPDEDIYYYLRNGLLSSKSYGL